MQKQTRALSPPYADERARKAGANLKIPLPLSVRACARSAHRPCRRREVPRVYYTAFRAWLFIKNLSILELVFFWKKLENDS